MMLISKFRTFYCAPCKMVSFHGGKKKSIKIQAPQVETPTGVRYVQNCANYLCKIFFIV